jgi:ATP-dependent DNA ligase
VQSGPCQFGQAADASLLQDPREATRRAEVLTHAVGGVPLLQEPRPEAIEDWTENRQRRVDALLVGYYDGRQLHFAGKVRAGFTPRLRREVAAELKPFHVGRCPFVDLPHARASRWGGGGTPEQMAEIQWVRPAPVAQIRFIEWPAGGHLRHSAFLGLRKDKRAAAVRREPL